MKTKTVQTSIGPLTVTPLTQDELKTLILMRGDRTGGPWATLRRYMEILQRSIARHDPQFTMEKFEQIAASDIFQDVDAVLTAVAEISSFDPKAFPIHEA